MTIDDQELRAIHFLALRVRKATTGAGPWDADGLMSNLRKIADRNLHITVEHVLRHAADPNAKTPGVLAGSYTPIAPTPPAAGNPTPATACATCGGFRGACVCRLDRRTDDEPIQPMSRDELRATLAANRRPSAKEIA